MNETREVIVGLCEPQHGVVSRRQLHEAAVASRALRHQIDARFVEPMSPQVLRLVGSPRTKAQLAMAGVLDAPGLAYLSHFSAAAWWKIPGFAIRAPIEVVIPWKGTNRRSRLAQIHYHRGLPKEHLTVLAGIPIVSPGLVIFLLAGTEGRGRAERALDHALSMRILRLRTMHDLLKQLGARGRDGIAAMRSLLAERPPDYVPPQSGLESRVERLALEVGVGLRRQIDVGDDLGWIGRVDFELEDSSDVIEVMSDRYHSSLVDRNADAERFSRIEGSGRRLLTIWDHDVWSRPEQVRRQIHLFWLGRSTPGEQHYAPEVGMPAARSAMPLRISRTTRLAR
jgi:very-short-patch-repair endonuclease